MSAFPFQNFRSRKNSKTTYQAIHEIFLLPWMEPSMWGSGNTFRAWLCDNCVPRVKIPSSPYTTDEKIFTLGKKMNKYGNWVWPWVSAGAVGSRGEGGALLASAGRVLEDSYSPWMHCPLQLGDWAHVGSREWLHTHIKFSSCQLPCVLIVSTPSNPVNANSLWSCNIMYRAMMNYECDRKENY